MSQHYDDDLDEVVMGHNPKGGKPTQTGALVWKDEDGLATYEIQKVTEDMTYRHFLGYCPCGRKILVGPKRAEILMGAFEKRGIRPHVPRVPLRMRLARRLAGGDM